MGNCCFNPRRAAVWADGDEWEEEEFAAAKSAAAAEAVKVDHRVEVKIRVTKRQLQELLEKAAGGGGKAKAAQRQAEDVLAELMTSGRVCYQQQHEEMRGRNWRPALYSIPEAAAEESS